MVSRKGVGYLEGFVSIIVNTILFALKYVIGLIFNSISVIADSIHTLSDSLTSIVVILGFWIAYKPADKEHPFGHGRAEQVGGVIIGTLLGVIATQLFIDSYEKLMRMESMTFSWILVAVMSLSAVVKEVLARWAIRLGRKYDSKSLIADAWHHRSDAIASSLVAIGVLAGRDLWWIDSVLGMGLSALIAYTAVKVVLDSSRELLGHAPTPQMEVEILKTIASVAKEVRDVHHIHVHRYGEHTEVTLHIRLPPSTSLSDAHTVATKIENELKRKYGWEVTVHVEPTIE